MSGKRNTTNTKGNKKHSKNNSPVTVDKLCQDITKNKISDIRKLVKSPSIKDVINSPDKDDILPLFHAISARYIDVVELLLRYGADLNKANANDETPLSFAEKGNRVEIMELLLKRKAEVMSPSNLLVNTDVKEFDKVEKWIEVLDIAIKSKCDKVVDMLMGRWGEIDAQDKGGSTLLHLSIFLRFINVTTYLIDRKVDLLSVCNSDGHTPLHIAAQQLNVEAIKLLCERAKAVVTTLTKKKQTALHLIIEGLSNVIAGLDFSDPNNVQGVNQNLQKTLRSCNPVLQQKLLANFNSQSDRLERARSMSINDFTEKACKTADLLLDAGVDPNIQDYEGCTPLHLVTKIDNEEIVTRMITLLVDKKANLELLNKDGKAPLHMAAQAGNADSVKMLLGYRIADSKGSKAEHKRHRNVTLEAVGDGSELSSHMRVAEIMENMLQGRYPDHSTNEYKLDEDVSRADVKAPVGDGGNLRPLHLAAIAGDTKIAKLLMQNGADPFCVDRANLTPANYAEIGDQEEVAKVLSEHETTSGTPSSILDSASSKKLSNYDSPLLR